MPGLRFKPNQKSPHPIGRQLYESIRLQIVSGELAAGSIVPSSRELADQLRLSRSTVVKAYEQLKNEGYLDVRGGARPRVIESVANVSLAENRNPFDSSVLSQYAVRVSQIPLYQPRQNEPRLAFYPWRPALPQAPMAELGQIVGRLCRSASALSADYPSHAQGHPELREAIAEMVYCNRGIRATAGQIVILSGWQQALQLIARLHLDRADYVAVENPCYPGVRQILQAENAQIHPISVDENGIVASELTRLPNRFRLIYLSPSHQLPTGAVLSLERRLEILSWARSNNSYVIEDEHDSEFRFEGEPVLPLIALDGICRVIFFGTFHMTLFPSMALSYLILPQELVPIYTRARQLCSEQIPSLWQQALAEYIQSGGLKRHVRKMRQLYGACRAALVNALESRFQERVTTFGDNAGLHLLARFATKLSTHTIIEKAGKSGIGLISSADYYVSHPPNAEFLLGYGSLNEREIVRGIDKLRAIIQ